MLIFLKSWRGRGYDFLKPWRGHGHDFKKNRGVDFFEDLGVNMDTP